MLFPSRNLRLALVLGITSLLGVGCGDGGTETGGAGGALVGVGGLGAPGGSGGALPSGGAGGSLATGGVLVGAGGVAAGGASGGDSATGGVPAAGGIGSGGIGGAVGGGSGDGGSIGTGGGSATLEWLPVWATTIQSLEPDTPGQMDKVPPSLPGNTARQFIWPTLSGDTVRLQLSNEKGASPLDISKVHIALAKDTSDPKANAGQIDAGTDVALTFNGQPNVSIPAGETVWSDGVAFPLREMKLTAISIQFAQQVPSNVTFHPGSRTTSYFATGDAVATAAAGTLGTRDRWYVIETLEAMAPADASAIACLGDSITDGYGILNTFERWTDAFTLALKKDPALASTRSVLNFGMGANTLVTDQTYQDSGVHRFERDVLNSDFSAKIKYLIVLEGVNDINGGAAASAITAAYTDIATRARAKGITVFVSPITPMNAANSVRDSINQTVRSADYYDPGVDFDIALRDPNNPNNRQAAYIRDDNDALHPSAAGYKAMADSIDLTLFH